MNQTVLVRLSISKVGGVEWGGSGTGGTEKKSQDLEAYRVP